MEGFSSTRRIIAITGSYPALIAGKKLFMNVYKLIGKRINL
jgi:hypothetical protein